MLRMPTMADSTRDLLVAADSLCSLILFREKRGLSEQTERELHELVGRLRAATERPKPTAGPYRPRLLVDFDGVLHAYSRGWADGTAYDPPIPGAREALDQFERDGYEVVIFSTRDRGQIADWLLLHEFPMYPITNEKRPAVAIVDDRAVHFTDWDSAAAAVRTRYPVRRG